MKYILIFLLGLSINSCVSFPKELSKENKKQIDKDLLNFNGTYDVNIDDENYLATNILKGILYRGEKNIPRSNPNNEYLFKIKIINPTSINFTLLESDTILKSKTIAIKKIKHNSIYLKNKNVLRHNIPFILGGLDTNKDRLSLDKKGNLVIENANESIGAFLFFLWSGSEHKSTVYYPKR